MSFLNQRHQLKWFIIINVFIFVAMTACIVLSSPTYDYHFYMRQWQGMLLGQNPWRISGPVNAYGPFYNLFAYPYGIYNNLPRFLFASSWFFTSVFLLWKLFQKDNIPLTIKFCFWFLLLYSPLFIIFVTLYGVNDSIMAALVGLCLYCYYQQQDIIAGLALGSAILIKFIPIFIVPFLVFSHKNIRWKFGLVIFLLVFLVFLAEDLMWGKSAFSPLIFQGMRHAKLLSIFNFLNGPLSPLRLLATNYNVESLSMPMLLIGLIILFYLHIKYQFSPIFASVLVTVFALAINKVGNLQYFLTPLIIITCWIYLEYDVIKKNNFNFSALWFYLFWIEFLCWLYYKTGWFYGHHLRASLGLPTFIIEVYFIYALLKFGLGRNKIEPANCQVNVNPLPQAVRGNKRSFT